VNATANEEAPSGGAGGGVPPGDASPRAADGFVEPRQLELDVDEPQLFLELEGWEGPLDLLLALARQQKVDLTRISILKLVDQYLAYVERIRRRQLENAADHLVMAAWLAYLKSRLLLPSPAPDAEPSGEELAAALAFRLRRLEAIRDAAAKLVARHRLGRDVFTSGTAGSLVVAVEPRWDCDLGELLSGYAGMRQRQIPISHRVLARSVLPLAEARDILVRLVGEAADWVPIGDLVLAWAPPGMRATAIASTFSAGLELVREGKLELAQAEAFAPLFARVRAGMPASETPAAEGSAQGADRPGEPETGGDG
jgi:segregation and condensation protein A